MPPLKIPPRHKPICADARRKDNTDPRRTRRNAENGREEGRAEASNNPHASRRRSRLSARLLTGAALLLGALLILQAHPAFAQGKSLLWERFDVDIIVRKDSSFDVTEHQTIRFTRGTFTYGYRDIPKKNLSSLDGWTLTDASGNNYRYASYGKEPYTFTVTEKASRYVIYWYFPPHHQPQRDV